MLDYKELQEIDLKLYLLSGSDIKIGNLVIKPYTLEEIREYGFSNYMKNLQLMSISIDDFLSSVTDDNKLAILEEQRANLRTLDFYITLGGQELLYGLLNALSMIFRTSDVRLLDEGMIAINFVKMGVLKLDEDGGFVANDEKLEALNEDNLTIVHRENFDEIVEVVKLQNYLSKPESKEEDIPYADEETRKLMEEMENHRKIVESKKKAQRQSEGEDDNVDISDIVSAISSKSNSINKLNIWQFTLYQLYDEYSRLELIDNYDFSIRAMMAGAEKIELKHWSSKL